MWTSLWFLCSWLLGIIHLLGRDSGCCGGPLPQIARVSECARHSEKLFIAALKIGLRVWFVGSNIGTGLQDRFGCFSPCLYLLLGLILRYFIWRSHTSVEFRPWSSIDLTRRWLIRLFLCVNDCVMNAHTDAWLAWLMWSRCLRLGLAVTTLSSTPVMVFQAYASAKTWVVSINITLWARERVWVLFWLDCSVATCSSISVLRLLIFSRITSHSLKAASRCRWCAVRAEHRLCVH